MNVYRVWKNDYNKTYGSSREETEKFRIFQDNLRMINKLNMQFEWVIYLDLYRGKSVIYAVK